MPGVNQIRLIEHEEHLASGPGTRGGTRKRVQSKKIALDSTGSFHSMVLCLALFSFSLNDRCHVKVSGRQTLFAGTREMDTGQPRNQAYDG